MPLSSPGFCRTTGFKFGTRARTQQLLLTLFQRLTLGIRALGAFFSVASRGNAHSSLSNMSIDGGSSESSSSSGASKSNGFTEPTWGPGRDVGLPCKPSGRDPRRT